MNQNIVRPKVSIQGLKGAFHHIAANKFFGDDIEIVEKETFEDEFLSLQKDEIDHAVVAIENSIAGSIHQNYDLLLKYKFNIIGEIYLRIEHNLLGLNGQSISDIKEVRSHPMAILQCQDFLQKHHFKVVEHFDTAGSAKEIAEENLIGIGSIASSLAAEIYGLEIIQKGIETDKQNFTRFLIVSKNDSDRIKNKISISVILEDKPGSLYKAIRVFDVFKVNMTKIESRPIIGKPWEYRFFIDFEVTDEKQTPLILEAIKTNTHEVVVLGEYKGGIANGE